MKGCWLMAFALAFAGGCVKRPRTVGTFEAPQKATPESPNAKGEGGAALTDGHGSKSNPAAGPDDGFASKPSTDKLPKTNGQDYLGMTGGAEGGQVENDAAGSEGERLYNEAIIAIREGELERAMAYYLSSCQLGWVHSCHRYGWHLERHGNHQNARQFYELACTRGILKSCNNIGAYAETTSNWSDAKNYYSLACLKRHDVACKNLVRVEMMARQGTATGH